MRVTTFSAGPIRACLLASLLIPVTGASAQITAGAVVVSVGKTSVAASQELHTVLSTTTVDTAHRFVRTDSSDERRPFTLLDVPAGRYRLEAKVIGFVPETAYVDVAAGKTARVEMELRHSAIVLEKVETAGNGKGHLADFERRRAAGKGTFLTREDIQKKGQHSIAESLRGVRGLRVDCQSTCKAQMVRSTNCEPSFFVNGFPTDSQILFTPVLDVAGIEIYRGPSETPGEFLGSNAMCGAIVIWTK